MIPQIKTCSQSTDDDDDDEDVVAVDEREDEIDSLFSSSVLFRKTSVSFPLSVAFNDSLKYFHVFSFRTSEISSSDFSDSCIAVVAVVKHVFPPKASNDEA